MPSEQVSTSGSFYRIAFTGAISGFLFGYNTAVINGALPSLSAAFHLTALQVELATSSVLYGCLLGALSAGSLIDRYGRRSSLNACAILSLAAAVLTAIPHALAMICIARFVGGLAIGLSSTVAPLYLAEISPQQKRGSIVTFNQVAIVTGILIAYCANWALAPLGADAWRWMFGAASLPALAFLICLRSLPESPRWLVQQRRENEARTALTVIWGPRESENILQAMLAIEEEAPPAGWMRRMRKPLALAVLITALQQMTGINTVIYYGSVLFGAHSGNGATAAFAANVLIGLTNLVFTLAALGLVDKIGRRTLLGGSAVVMLGALLLLVFELSRAQPNFPLIVASTMLYVGSFAIGLGPGSWIYIAEIFPTNMRGRAMSMATTVLWASCILVSNTFLTLIKALGASGAFSVYAGICAVAAIFFFRLPETRGRPLEEIERFWQA